MYIRRGNLVQFAMTCDAHVTKELGLMPIFNSSGGLMPKKLIQGATCKTMYTPGGFCANYSISKKKKKKELNATNKTL